MCRWLAYCGEPLRPSEVILHPQHSLIAQSLDSPLGAETVNGDGFGFGWYPADPPGDNVPGLFRSTDPAWNDQNLRELTQAIESPLFFSHVRAAAGPPIQQTNCHPFRFQNWLFMHNGAIAGFGSVKRELAFAVDPSLYPHIQGTTDSEVLFHLALTLGLREDPIAAMTKAIQMVESAGHEHGVTFRCRAPSQSPMAAPCGPSGTPRSTRRAPCSTRPTSPRCSRCTRTPRGCASLVSMPTSWSRSR